MRVGPDSAGAVPGPVCYGRGGKLATVTDADLVLGISRPDNFLGGRMKLDLAAATAAIREQIAEPLGMSVEAAAAGIRRVVDGHMADTLREVTIGRGHDPRDFVLLRLWRRRAGALHRLRRRARRAAHSHSGNQHGAFGLWRARLRHPAIGRALAAAARRAAAPAIPGTVSTARASMPCSPNWRSAALPPWSSRDFAARSPSSPARSTCATAGRPMT